MKSRSLKLNFILALLLVMGCQGIRDKHCAELSCPTDIRKSHAWIGEDAIMRCPCGPDEMFHGYKATHWGEWPTSVVDWRGPAYVDVPAQPMSTILHETPVYTTPPSEIIHELPSQEMPMATEGPDDSGASNMITEPLRYN